MSRYSRHRPFIHTYIVRKQERIQDKDTAKIAVKARGAKGLLGGAEELEGQKVRNCRASEKELQGQRRTRWFARGPVYLDQVARVAPRGGYAVLVWLAVRARQDSANGAPVDTKRIVEATGLNVRTINKAVAALVEAGILKRDGRKISLCRFT